MKVFYVVCTECRKEVKVEPPTDLPRSPTIKRFPISGNNCTDWRFQPAHTRDVGALCCA
jgi:hypothetical protein